MGGKMKIRSLAVLLVVSAFVAGACNRGGDNTNVNRTNSGTPVSTPTATPIAANTDPTLKTAIESALKAKGFDKITVDITTTPATIRGTYPKGKLAEVVQTAQVANGGKPVKNEATEEK
jgi:hypothetical protein